MEVIVFILNGFTKIATINEEDLNYYLEKASAKEKLH